MTKKYSVNLLALPKNPKFMRCFVAPPGLELMQMDIAALEPHVFTFLSKDPTLTKVYGKGAWPYHDIYFIAGMQIPGIGDQIREHYDINNPSLEGIKHLKKTMGNVRKKKLKPAFLGWMYGLGAETLSINLEIPKKEAEAILRGIDKQFPGKTWLQGALLKQWADRGGYVIDARGMPTCLDYKKKKDINNRVIQKSGHELLQRTSFHLNNIRKRDSIPMRPYIPDFHDEIIWAIKPGYREIAAAAVNEALDMLNSELGWEGVLIKHGGILFGNNLTLRCEEEDVEEAFNRPAEEVFWGAL